MKPSEHSKWTFILQHCKNMTQLTDIAFSVSKIMPQELAIYQNLYDVEIPARISQIKAEHDSAIIRKRQTAFDVLLKSNLPDYDKSEERLQGEAGVFMIAGTDITSWTLTVAMFYLCRILSSLRNVVAYRYT